MKNTERNYWTPLEQSLGECSFPEGYSAVRRFDRGLIFSSVNGQMQWTSHLGLRSPNNHSGSSLHCVHCVLLWVKPLYKNTLIFRMQFDSAETTFDSSFAWSSVRIRDRKNEICFENRIFPLSQLRCVPYAHREELNPVTHRCWDGTNKLHRVLPQTQIIFFCQEDNAFTLLSL